MTENNATQAQRHRVLLIDDQKIIGEAVRRMLASESDILFSFCSSADEAVTFAIEFKPTVILQDLVMAGLSGLELARRYRATPSLSQVPVIVLSSQEDATVKAELFQAGANDYLVKLPDRIELIARIRVHSEAYQRLLERDFAFSQLEASLLQLDREKAKSEGLLLNILPHSIAEKLKNNQATIAQSFESVTVMFADLSGFTEYSQHIHPQSLLTLLDEIFSAFDHLASDHSVEKIKTIGDAYMAASGVPEISVNHAEAMADMTLEMIDVFERIREKHNFSLRVRIGMHSGSVVAGVIGKHKFSYDLWGDTVNIASRMESHGEASRIHVSQTTRDLLQSSFRFEERGEITIKGKGVMRTYFLLGRISSTAP